MARFTPNSELKVELIITKEEIADLLKGKTVYHNSKQKKMFKLNISIELKGELT